HRQGWFECACCPPNIARLLASLGNYVYSQCPGGLAVHLYLQSSVQVHLDHGEPLTLSQETNYPWEGKVRFQVELETPREFSILLRIPGWVRSFQLRVNQETVTKVVKDGYATLKRQWRPGDQLELQLEMPVEIIRAHPAVWQNAGRVALQRGPLVYCLEEGDHSLPVTQIMLPKKPELQAHFEPDTLGGIMVVEGEGLRFSLKNWGNTLYQSATIDDSLIKIPFKAIPYYAWDNRDPGTMVVWIPQAMEDLPIL
ncbi:MAG TPA: glycoside hydrolase family 127 protein, partial [Bacillota bacterium]|nr:glycoside hydrolase family 127 protein [Bacillota bacterium]